MAVALEDRQLTRRESAEQSPDERRLHSLLDQMLAETRNFRSKLEPKWEENIDYERGEQWSTPRPQGLSQITDNHLWRVVQQSAALLTDTRPYIEITSRPNDEAWDKVNKKLKQLVEAQWFLNEVDRLLVRIVYDLYATGVGYLKCYWDPYKEWELGDISIARINPKHLYIDPNSDGVKRAEFICYRIPVSLWEIRRRFDPERAGMVQPDASLSSWSESKMPFRYPLPVPRRKARVFESAVPKAWLEEWWIRDPARTETLHAKYPAGRMITRAGNVFLADAPNPYWMRWPGPWIEFKVNPLDDTPYGEPDLNQLKSLMDAINVLISLVVDNTRYMTNGIWVVDENALAKEERDKLPATRPATVISKRPGSQVSRDTGQALPGQITEIINMLKQDIQFISGLMDTGYGQRAKGIVAQGAIELLQMATQATIRLKAREIESGLLDLGQSLAALMFQHYGQKRVVDYLGPSAIEPVSWDPQELAPLVGDPNIPIGETDRQRLIRQFRVRMAPGSSLALSKERQWAMELALYSAGLIDEQAVLEKIDYPNRDAIIRRMAERQQQLAMMGVLGKQRQAHSRSAQRMLKSSGGRI